MSISKVETCVDDGRGIIYADAFTPLFFCADVDALRRALKTYFDHWAAPVCRPKLWVAEVETGNPVMSIWLARVAS